MRFCRYFNEFVSLRQQSNKPIIIVGDLNVAYEERDLANWAANRKNAGFLPEEHAREPMFGHCRAPQPRCVDA